MSDIALLWDINAQSADFEIESNDLALDEGLTTSILLSLFTDRRAELSDQIPDSDPDRRGWWGDNFPIVEGDKIGSRLWLLSRSKNTQDVLDRAEEYTREALQWMLDDRVTDRIDVTVDAVTPELQINVSIFRPKQDPVTFRFNRNWAEHEEA